MGMVLCLTLSVNWGQCVLGLVTIYVMLYSGVAS